MYLQLTFSISRVMQRKHNNYIISIMGSGHPLSLYRYSLIILELDIYNKYNILVYSIKTCDVTVEK